MMGSRLRGWAGAVKYLLHKCEIELEQFLTHSDEKFAEHKLGQMEDTHQPLEWSSNQFLDFSQGTGINASVGRASINT